MTAHTLDYASQRVAGSLSAAAEDELNRLSLLCRVFFRAKSSVSAEAKKIRKSYGPERKLQDAVGLRIALYFSDDVEIAIDAVKRAFSGRYVGTTRDVPEADSFCPKRMNLIFRMEESEAAQVGLVRLNPDWVDSTFEVQIRTILSEGWHEVDHDLRYKCQSDWVGNEDLERSLNGLMATLETCDWAILQLFDELALRHYRGDNWAAMLRCKLRLRIGNTRVRPDLCELLTGNRGLARRLFRVDRRAILRSVARSDVALPSTYDNWLFVMNQISIQDPRILALAPDPVREGLLRLGSQTDVATSRD
jgi:ppGpp synthetase/RelA/SpoT-type nucleotidyltranferase